jgi:GumC protein
MGRRKIDLEEVIDLRPYIKSLLSRWRLIIGITVVVTVIGFGVSFLLPARYQATALITITDYDQVTLSSLTIFDLDPTFAQEIQPDPLTRIYIDLAESDELLQLVLEEIEPMLDEESNIDSVDDLQEKLNARIGTDFSLLILTANDSNPQLAAALVNTWANLFAPWVNEKFDSQGLQNLTFFEEQLIEAENVLNAAEANLVQHQSMNNTTTISNTLNFYDETQKNYLNDRQALLTIRQDVEYLQNQFLASPTNSQISLADQITAVNLQLSSFDPQSANLTQLQVDPGVPLIGSSRQANTDFLMALDNTLEAKINFINTALQELEPEILTFQAQLETALSENRKLVRERNAAEETYTAILRKVTEERISVAQQQVDNVMLVSEAVTPKKPMSSSRILYAIGGGVVGFMLTVISIIGFEWWKEFEDDTEA